MGSGPAAALEWVKQGMGRVAPGTFCCLICCSRGAMPLPPCVSGDIPHLSFQPSWAQPGFSLPARPTCLLWNGSTAPHPRSGASTRSVSVSATSYPRGKIQQKPPQLLPGKEVALRWLRVMMNKHKPTLACSQAWLCCSGRALAKHSRVSG